MHDKQRQPDLLQDSFAAFQRELPRLLGEHKHRWVLYRGGARVALADGQWDLFDECDRRGWNPEDCLIQPIIEEPDPLDQDAIESK